MHSTPSHLDRRRDNITPTAFLDVWTTDDEWIKKNRATYFVNSGESLFALCFDVGVGGWVGG